MITVLDLIADMISGHGWEIRDIHSISTERHLLNIRRIGFKYNVLIIDHGVKVFDTLKAKDYIKADVSLFDPSSTDQLEKIFQ